MLPKALILVYFLSLSLLFLHPINSGDFFHHLNSGKYVITHFSLPYLDDLSFTAFGKGWVAYGWGSGVIFYLIYTLFGPNGISILFALLGALASLFLFLTLKHLQINLRLNLTLTSLGAALISLRWPTRPEVLGPLFLIALVFLLTKLKKPSLLLIPFFWLWGIIYGASAFLGILILLFYIVVNKFFDKKNLSFLVLSTGASMLNGYGLKSFFYIFQIPQISPHLGEWLPLIKAVDPNLPDLVLFYQYIVLSYLLFVVFYLAIILLGIFKLKKSILTHAFYLGVSLTILAPFYTNRFMNLAPLMTIPILAIIANKLQLRTQTILLSLVIIMVIFTSFIRFSNFNFGVGLEANPFQKKIIDFLKQSQINGNIFAVQEIGSFISWELPKSKIFVDTRDDLYEQVDIFQELRKLDEGKINIITLLDAHKADIVLADIANGRVYKPLLYHQDWSIVYVTDGFFIAVRKTLKEKHNLDEFDAIDPLRIPPAKPGDLEQAEQEIKRLLHDDPTSTENQVRMIELKLALNKPQEAKSILEDLNLTSRLDSKKSVFEISNLELKGKVYLANIDCELAFSSLRTAEQLSFHQLIFFPKVRLPTAVDRLLGEYYTICTNDKVKAKEYFLKYLENNNNPLERRYIEQKLELIDNQVL